MEALSTEALLRVAEISCAESTPWGTSLPEKAGVYIVTIPDPGAVGREALRESERTYWTGSQPIIYIGRGRNLRRRLKQFYGHKYGNRAPHRGGQAILLIDQPKTIHWAACQDYPDVERRLLEAFVAASGSLPFGNRIQSARTERAASGNA